MSDLPSAVQIMPLSDAGNLPCPFCGRADKLESIFVPAEGDRSGFRAINCCGCGGSGPLVPHDAAPDRAAAVWNVRAFYPRLAGEVAGEVLAHG